MEGQSAEGWTGQFILHGLSSDPPSPKAVKDFLDRYKYHDNLSIIVHQSWRPDSSCRSLSSFIWKSTSLRRVYISFLRYLVVDRTTTLRLRRAMGCLVTAVSKNPHIEVLGVEVNAYTCGAIAQELVDCSTLKILRLMEPSALLEPSPQDLCGLATALGTFEPETVLNLDFQDRSSVLPKLVKEMSNMDTPHPQHLMVSGSPGPSTSLRYLLHSPGTRIRSLSMMQKSDTNTEFLKEALEHGDSIEIIMWRMHIRADFQCLVEILECNKTLKSLSCFLPVISDSDSKNMLAFTAALKENSTLETLIISCDAEDLRHLAAVIPFLSLKELSVALDDSRLHQLWTGLPTVLDGFRRGLEQNKTLQDVEVTCKTIDETFPHFHVLLKFFVHRNKVIFPLLRDCNVGLASILDAVLGWKEATWIKEDPTFSCLKFQNLISQTKALFSHGHGGVLQRSRLGMTNEKEMAATNRSAQLTLLGTSLMLFCFQERPDLALRVGKLLIL
jgi:hypothetical protein